ncbi:MAG: NYN domain-containing protein, partial [Acidimicrobiaceae bacterium]|nr:NYN domain-containing protein [Acidimicrobiaceae bacterium]
SLPTSPAPGSLPPESLPPESLPPESVSPESLPPEPLPRALAVLGASPAVTSTPDALEPAGEETAEARRQPQPLPPAVFEDSPEAAAHLVRSGVLLLVDGYNISLFAWPELSLPDQRHRMTTSLAELAARTGASVRVVFDGDEQVAYPETRGGVRTPVRVLFSTPGVDADEVIIGLVEEHPHDRPVVVATNDRRVQDEVRRRGANVLTISQLLGLLRRTGTRFG